MTISLRTKVTMITSYVIVMIFLLVSVVYYISIRSYAINRIDQQALKISEVGRTLVDGNAFQKAMQLKDKESQAYKEVQLILNILSYLTDSGDLFAMAVDGEGLVYLGNDFNDYSLLNFGNILVQQEDDVITQLNEGNTYYFRNDNKAQGAGRLKGALIPIHNSDEELVGIIGYEVEDRFYTNLELIKWIIILSAVVIATVCILFNYLGFKILLKPINKLMKAFNKIAKGDFKIELDTNRKDEVGKINRNIIKSCERMSQMVEYITISSTNLRLIAEKILQASMKSLIAFEEVANSTREISLISYEQVDKRASAKLAITYLEEDVRILLTEINKEQKDCKVSKELIEQMSGHVSTIKKKIYELDHVFEIIDKHTVNLVTVTERQVASSEEFTAMAENLNQEAESLSKSISQVKS